MLVAFATDLTVRLLLSRVVLEVAAVVEVV
jgi:hypothetical protein